MITAGAKTSSTAALPRRRRRERQAAATPRAPSRVSVSTAGSRKVAAVRVAHEQRVARGCQPRGTCGVRTGASSRSRSTRTAVAPSGPVVGELRQRYAPPAGWRPELPPELIPLRAVYATVSRPSDRGPLVRDRPLVRRPRSRDARRAPPETARERARASGSCGRPAGGDGPRDLARDGNAGAGPRLASEREPGPAPPAA
jgi:hypothetical protein